MGSGTTGFKDPLLGEDGNELQHPPICISEKLSKEIMWWYHDSTTATHTGGNDMLDQIRKNYYWRTMVADVKAYVQSCLRCRKAKQTSRNRFRGVGQPPIPSTLYHTVFMDVVHVSSGGKGVQSYSGNTHILSIQDRLSGHSNLMPICLKITDEQKNRGKARKIAAKKATGKRKEELKIQDNRILNERAAVIIATKFFNRVCLTLHKKPRVLICDNGTEFNNALLKKLSELLEIKLIHTAPENPRANYVERIHSVLGQRLKILTNDNVLPSHRSWDEYVPYIQHALNNRLIVDRICPADIMFGRNDNLAIDELDTKIKASEATSATKPAEQRSLVHHAHAMARRQQDMETMFSTEILARQEKLLKRFQRKQYKEYQIGDRVILHRKNVGSSSKRTSSKLNLKWSGPHTIVERTKGPDVYIIKLYNSNSTIRASSDLLAPLSKDITERPLQRTLWQSDEPRCAADLYPVQGDKLIIIGLPKFLLKSNAKVKGKGTQEFYVVEFVRKTSEGNECEVWEIILLGHTVKRKSTVAVSSCINPELSAHIHAWSSATGTTGRTKAVEVVYSKADQTGKDLHLLKFEISDEIVLPIVPFSLNENSTIPKRITEKIKLLLEQRIPHKERK
jgi:hypothetical protein